MKTIILSDVLSNSESIIPYGLRLARAMESEADVLHIIDTRVHQAKYTPVADSQSITPGDTFSPEEIIEREKERAAKAMDNLLSSETSRLNYPLKVNRLIEVNNLEDELEKQADENPDSLFVISSEADNRLFDSVKDIISSVKNTGINAMVVTPGQKFKDYENVLMPADLQPKQLPAFNGINFLFYHFDFLLNAVAVANDSNYLKLEAEAATWEQVAKDYFLDKTKLEINILSGDDYVKTITGYAAKNNFDLIVYVKKKQSFVKEIFSNDDLNLILKKTKLPVLIHFYK